MYEFEALVVTEGSSNPRSEDSRKKSVKEREIHSSALSISEKAAIDVLYDVNIDQ